MVAQAIQSVISMLILMLIGAWLAGKDWFRKSGGTGLLSKLIVNVLVPLYMLNNVLTKVGTRKKLWEIVQSGQLGKVQMITMNFGSFKEYNMENRFFNMHLAGGAMLDIGVYALSIVRSFMDEKPEDIVSQWQASPTGSDEMATILLKNGLGQMATVALSMHSKQPKRAMISCEKAYIEIMEYPRADKAMIVDAETGVRTEIEAGSTPEALGYELQDMEQAVVTGDVSGLKLSYSADVMEIMTRLRKAWNMKYPGEQW